MNTESNTSSESASGRPGIDRRALIKRAAIVGGAAWVAPTILNVSAAGATTVQCYSFKLDASSTDPNDCVASAGGACPPPNFSVACPTFGPGGIVTATSGYSSGNTFTITLEPGCYVHYFAVKAGTTCLVKCSSESGCSSYRSGQTWTFTQSTGNNNSHVSLKVCCGS